MFHKQILIVSLGWLGRRFLLGHFFSFLCFRLLSLYFNLGLCNWFLVQSDWYYSFLSWMYWTWLFICLQLLFSNHWFDYIFIRFHCWLLDLFWFFWLLLFNWFHTFSFGYFCLGLLLLFNFLLNIWLNLFIPNLLCYLFLHWLSSYFLLYNRLLFFNFRLCSLVLIIGIFIVFLFFLSCWFCILIQFLVCLVLGVDIYFFACILNLCNWLLRLFILNLLFWFCFFKFWFDRLLFLKPLIFKWLKIFWFDLWSLFKCFLLSKWIFNCLLLLCNHFFSCRHCFILLCLIIILLLFLNNSFNFLVSISLRSSSLCLLCWCFFLV